MQGKVSTSPALGTCRDMKSRCKRNRIKDMHLSFLVFYQLTVLECLEHKDSCIPTVNIACGDAGLPGSGSDSLGTLAA